MLIDIGSFINVWQSKCSLISAIIRRLMKIKTNEGRLDRILRIVGGLLLLALAGFGFAGSGV